ncbi:MAG TPA: PLP-dependent aminotransferase family protein [Longimicrobium sp.]|uniref:MocR-like pyridoxine biosynthesis transcription factor PdxR n=1 Tax=Longimicrobium sp. TaxID=2029185 RepID=UPI002ED85148
MSPRRASSAPPALVAMSADGSAPLHVRIYGALREAIIAGRLAPGTRVPALRVLAAELGVSRNTVRSALAQLRAEGYVAARERSGTFVAAALPDRALATPSAPGSARAPGEVRSPGLSRRGAELARLSAAGAEYAPGRDGSAPRAFRTGVPALDAFPWPLWARLAGARTRRGAAALGDYDAAAGFGPLRAAIAAHVAAARGTTCTARQVIVTSGAQQGLALLARLLLDPGDAVWMEDPGYPRARAVFAAAGARVVPVAVDGDGIDVAQGVARAPGARLAYVTPSHQYPTGAVLSASRRLALLQWAADAGAWVVEDDYDSTYRYASRPLACLHGLDGGGRVIYLGTFSKTLFPSLRLGYLIVPPALADAFAAARGALDWHSATLPQAVLADFIDGGHYARHVRRMRMLYAERRDAVLDEAARCLGERLRLGAGDAGMHLVGHLAPGGDDRALSARLLAAGVEAPALSAFAVHPAGPGGLLLGYAAFAPPVLRAAVRQLAAVLDQQGSAPRTVRD